MSGNTQIGVQVSADADGAIAAMQQLASSIDQLGGRTRALAPPMAQAAAHSSAFAHAFDHFGAHEASIGLTELAGVTGSVRPLIMALTRTIMGGATALGLTAGAVAPFVAGFAAIAGVYMLVKGNAEKHAETLDQTAQKESAALKTTDDLKTSLDAYGKVMGVLPSSLNALKQATIELDAVQRGNLTGTEGQQLAAARAKIASDKEQIASAQELQRQVLARLQGNEGGMVRDKDIRDGNEYAATIRKLTTDMKTQQQVEALTIADIKAQGEGYLNNADKMAKTSQKATELAEATDRQNQAFTEAYNLLQEDGKAAEEAAKKFDKFTIANAARIAQLNDTTKKEGGDPIIEKAEKETVAIHKRYAAEMADLTNSAMTADQIAARKVTISAQENSEIQALNKRTALEERDQIGQVGQIFASTFQGAVSEVGKDTAQMIVEHKSWHDATISLTKDVESQFISMVTTMIEKWLIFEALTGGGASVGFANNFVGGAFHALGTDTMVDTPTPFVAGESGPERVTVTPMYAGGGSSGSAAGGQGGGGASVGSTQIVVNVSAAGVVSDLNAFANLIGQKVRQSVAGQGQLPLTRTA